MDMGQWNIILGMPFPILSHCDIIKLPAQACLRPMQRAEGYFVSLHADSDWPLLVTNQVIVLPPRPTYLLGQGPLKILADTLSRLCEE